MVRKLLYLLSWGLVTFILMGCVPDANPAIDSGDSSDGATRQVEICLGWPRMLLAVPEPVLITPM